VRHPALLDRERAVLVLIDLQEGYRHVLFGWQQVVAACATLVRGAGVLQVPLLVTEQYPRGLGRTADEAARWFPAGLHPIDKLTLSCCGEADFMARLEATGRSQVVVAGIEAHACVVQTVHDLLAAGYQVHVAQDATSSRRRAHVLPAWEKMRAAGMLPTSSEQALLELVRTARAVEFKALQAILKEAPAPLEPL
jgi:nicotinamidase-related amidase